MAPGHTSMVTKEGKKARGMHQCPFLHPDGTRCKRSGTDKYEIKRHVSELHKVKGADFTKDMKERLDKQVSMSDGKKLQEEYHSELLKAKKQ